MLRVRGDEVLLPILTTSACQEVQDPAAQRSVLSQSLELRNQCGRHYGVKCRTIIHKQHPHICRHQTLPGTCPSPRDQNSPVV